MEAPEVWAARRRQKQAALKGINFIRQIESGNRDIRMAELGFRFKFLVVKIIGFSRRWGRRQNDRIAERVWGRSPFC
jgi:hypothetical protein